MTGEMALLAYKSRLEGSKKIKGWYKATPAPKHARTTEADSINYKKSRGKTSLNSLRTYGTRVTWWDSLKLLNTSHK